MFSLVENAIGRVATSSDGSFDPGKENLQRDGYVFNTSPPSPVPSS